jgi:hypothetical protein
VNCSSASCSLPEPPSAGASVIEDMRRLGSASRRSPDSRSQILAMDKAGCQVSQKNKIIVGRTEIPTCHRLPAPPNAGRARQACLMDRRREKIAAPVPASAEC